MKLTDDQKIGLTALRCTLAVGEVLDELWPETSKPEGVLGEEFMLELDKFITDKLKDYIGELK